MNAPDNGTRYLIHQVGTPKIQRGPYGSIRPAGLWWQDTRPNCGQWVEKQQATTYPTTRASLPDGGEWVEIYIEVPAS
jgi:hypothetical protein